ncbi:DUF461 domain-containing protein [Streptomyces sp. JNUCC 64]
MSSSLRRGALAATAIAFSIASLAACGAGTNAQTLGIKPDNAAVTVGTIQVQNSNIITQPELEAKGPAVVSATVYNDGTEDQTLESVTVADGGKAELVAASGTGPVVVPAGGYVVIGGEGNAVAVLPSGREAVKDGDAQTVTYAFSETGDVKVDSFVVPASSYFKGWGPTEAPAAPAPEVKETSSTEKPASADATDAASPDATVAATEGAQDATGAATEPADEATEPAADTTATSQG